MERFARRPRATGPPPQPRRDWRANLDDWRRNGLSDSPRKLTIRRRRPVKLTPMPHEAKCRTAHGRGDGAVLAGMTREYWRASQVLRSLAIDRPCDRTTALRFLINLAQCDDYDRLRCVAGGTLVSLGLSGFARLAPAPGVRPVA